MGLNSSNTHSAIDAPTGTASLSHIKNRIGYTTVTAEIQDVMNNGHEYDDDQEFARDAGKFQAELLGLQIEEPTPELLDFEQFAQMDEHEQLRALAALTAQLREM